VACFDGLLVDALRKFDSQGVIRGLRAVSDFEYSSRWPHEPRAEPQLRDALPHAEPEYSFVSSRMIKEIARFGGE
jgi:pantetheine-phosphate adenylyltransferase